MKEEFAKITPEALSIINDAQERIRSATGNQVILVAYNKQ